jgi:hypothetical protein
VTPTDDIATERNRWFAGKFMAPRDFAADPDYLLSRHRLHNRMLHGWGIVCGLDVEHDPRPECARRWVVVTPGLGLDCHGRELVLEHELRFELPLDEEHTEPFLLGLRYTETAIEQVPVLDPEHGCAGSRAEANRVREGVELTVIPVTRDCWPTHHPKHHDEQSPGASTVESAAAPEPTAAEHSSRPTEPGPDHGEHEHEHHGHHGHDGCLRPHCPCGGVVPLARVVPVHDGFRLDLDGRRLLSPPPPLLTHITEINWPHGGTVTLHHLREVMGGELVVHFDRELGAADRHDAGWRGGRHDGRAEAAGVNQHTFAVQYAQAQEDLELLPYRHEPRGEGHRAVFEIDRRYLTPGQRAIAEATVYVTLHCDFIVDNRGVPVDGNHLRGRLPSGDGHQGGTFSSWFRVVFEERRTDDDGDR